MDRALLNRNPWSELEQLNDELGRWMPGLRNPTASEFPSVNIWTGEDEAVLVAELPGINPDDLDITVKENMVTLRGKREAEELTEDEAYVRRERGTGPFARTFRLPFKVDAGHVNAEYHRGILEVRMPRSAEDKPRKIKVNPQ